MKGKTETWEDTFWKMWNRQFSPLEGETKEPLDYHKLKDFIRKLLHAEYLRGRKEVVTELRKWAKGRNIDKEKLRQQLNALQKWI